MKKTVILFMLACAPLLGQAQGITITQNDAPSVGETWVQLGDSRPGMHQITAGGAGQTWNYANAFVVDDTTALDFISPSAVPASMAGGFPGADMAQYVPADSAALFFEKNSTGFYVEGLAADPTSQQGQLITTANYNPDLLVMPTPFSLGSTRNHTARMVIETTPPGSPFMVRLVMITVQSFSADASGSLTTPAGTYPSTLRVRQMSYTLDSTYANTGFGYVLISSNPPSDTAITYNWYKNGPGAWLMSITENSNQPGTSESALYLNNTVNAAPGFVSAPEALLVYPNPVGNRPLSFEITDVAAHKLVITDLLGRNIRTEYTAGANTLQLSTNSFRNGTYLYQLHDKAGRTLNSGRFVVAK